ncbi:MAG: SWIM zinc finger family protein [Anaerolineaceae bacterium]|nr:SWIM zinc finger family protein [Anaerolineaceae bacterium]
MKHIGTFAIWYDTAVPGWVAVSDKQQQSFGSGAKGEQEATRYALREAFPQVATAVDHLCTQYPEATSRAWAAAELLVLGHVLNPDPAEPDEVARVRSQRQAKHQYRPLRQPDGTLACDCPDFERGGLALAGEAFTNQLLCKHLLAYWLACHLAWPLSRVTPTPLHPKRSHAGRFRGRAVTAVGQNNRHELVPSVAAAQYANGQPVLPAHLTHYKAYIAYTQQRPFSQEKLFSWSLGR